MRTLPAPTDTVTDVEALRAELAASRAETAKLRQDLRRAELQTSALLKVIEVTNGITQVRDLVYDIGEDVASLVRYLGGKPASAPTPEPLPRTGVSPLRLVPAGAS